MYYFSGVWLIVLGILGAAGLIISKKPSAKELIDKLTPYQGWIGFVSAWWGIWGIIGALRLMSWSMGAALTWMIVGAVQFCLGMILGVGVIKTFVKNKDAQKKITDLVAKLIPFQGTLGLIAIGLGVWGIISSFIFTH